MVTNLMKNILYKLGLIADYVVEQGTSGIWTYEKWASGKAVCFGKNRTQTDTWVTWGSLYEANPYPTFTFPSGLFIEAPLLFPSAIPDGGGLLSCEVGSVTKDNIDYIMAVRPSPGRVGSTGIINYTALAIGKWK